YKSCIARAGYTTWTDSPAVRSEKTQVQTATAISSGTDGMQRRVPLEVFKTAFDGPDPLLRHVRTQVRSPHTNGVIQRWLSTLKYEHLFRGVITDGNAVDMEVHRFRIIYNTIRPHQALGDRTPSAADTACDQQTARCGAEAGAPKLGGRARAATR